MGISLCTFPMNNSASAILHQAPGALNGFAFSRPPLVAFHSCVADRHLHLSLGLRSFLIPPFASRTVAQTPFGGTALALGSDKPLFQTSTVTSMTAKQARGKQTLATNTEGTAALPANGASALLSTTIVARERVGRHGLFALGAHQVDGVVLDEIFVDGWVRWIRDFP